LLAPSSPGSIVPGTVASFEQEHVDCHRASLISAHSEFDKITGVQSPWLAQCRPVQIQLACTAPGDEPVMFTRVIPFYQAALSPWRRQQVAAAWAKMWLTYRGCLLFGLFLLFRGPQKGDAASLAEERFILLLSLSHLSCLLLKCCVV
jgi:hypothetical protein